MVERSTKYSISVPLYLQIADRVRTQIETGQLVPSQRLPTTSRLAREWGTSYETAHRALSQLAATGFLKRTRRLGTFVNGGSVRFPEGSHPLAFHSSVTLSLHRTVRIALFENWPTQQLVWQRIAELFNQQNRDVKMAIEWLPYEVTTLQSYQAFMQARAPDLVLLWHPLAREMQAANLLTPLPADLSRALRNAERYYSRIDGVDDDRMLDWAAPMHFSPWGFVWNEKLVEAPLDLATTSDPLVFAEWLGRIGARLPSGCTLMNNVCQLPSLFGLPARSPSKEDLAEFFHCSFQTAARLQPVADRLCWTYGSSPDQAMAPFMEGRQALCAFSLNWILNHLGQLTFPWKGTLLAPRRHQRIPTGCTLVGLSRFSRHPAHAAQVLQFLVSAPAQDLIAGLPINAAFLRTSNRLLLTHHRTCDEAAVHRSMEGLSLRQAAPFEWGPFIARDLLSLYQDVAHARQPASQAAEAAILQANQLLVRNRLRPENSP